MQTAFLPRSSPTQASAQLWRTATLVRISARRSLKVRYRGSALGILWSFANPLLMTALYTAVFGTAFARYYDNSVVRYLLSAFVGLVVATFFLNTTSEALVNVVSNGGLLNKIAIKPVVFPLAAVAANIFQQTCTTFPLVFVLSIVITHDPIRILLVPIVLLSLIALTTGFALALSALYVFFRDLSHLWGIASFVLWMTSPMFYPAEVVPRAVRVWLELNPLTQQIGALREVTLAAGPVHYSLVATALASGFGVCALGAVAFRAMRRDFMDLL